MRKFKAWWQRLRAPKITEQDLRNAFQTIGHAKDRDDMEWKLRKALFK